MRNTTFKPKINRKSKNEPIRDIKQYMNDQKQWVKMRNSKLKKIQNEKEKSMEVLFRPRICKKSKKLMRQRNSDNKF